MDNTDTECESYREPAKEFQSLKKENIELKNRLRKIEVGLSKRHIVDYRIIYIIYLILMLFVVL